MSSSIQLTVLGCGVLGRAIVDGLILESAPQRSYTLALTGRRPEAIEQLRKDYPMAVVTGDNKDAKIWTSKKDETHIVVIATQPHYTPKVCEEISQSVKAAGDSRQLVVVTVCPGISVEQLESWLPTGTPIMRTMPNTPISIKQGATAVFSNQYMAPELATEVQLIFQCISPQVATLPREDLMDIAASVSGSAPAYVYHLMHSLATAGMARGLPADIAHQLIVQSFIGAAKLAQTTPETPMQQLISDVCAPGGSTEKAVHTLDNLDATKVIHAAVEASWHANRAMSGGAAPLPATDSMTEGSTLTMREQWELAKVAE